ncbi:MAG: nucleotidyl transferase AbiEii/AbiGii toxin family protein [Pirellulaceae bacterium]
MPPEAVLSALRRAWTALESLHVPIALVGGLAMGAWKRPRFTKDVDLLIAIGEPRSREALQLLTAAGFRCDRPKPVVRVAENRFIQLHYDPPGAMLDVQLDLLLATTSFHEQALARRKTLPESELGFEVAVVSCEDLIILKLIAGRILDRVDVGELLKANRDSLDQSYLTGWVQKLQLERPFGEAWGDVFPQEAPPFSDATEVA